MSVERRWYTLLVAIAAHVLLAAILPIVARRWGRVAFAVAAVVPAATLVFALAHCSAVFAGRPLIETLSWAPGIGLELTVRMDALALLMIILVSGVGALVLCYYAGYAKPGAAGVGRNAVLLLVFAGSMLGLVLADDIFTLYIFWELTTVCSFLLVGGSGVTRASRRSATQALLVTGFGGLVLLLGLILLGTAAGTFRISQIVAAPPSGPVVSVAILLILVGAFTKSAQIPFHPWLPAAMIAPTPVSAYLHAAAMVKAGVYLIARFAPGFADLPAWWLPVLVLGVWTMILGGLRALRQHDLKRLLAFGTVSQLGFLTVLVGAGGTVAAMAGATMLLAHGLFKSSLFLAVGAIDRQAGTRDVRELAGLAKRWPVFTGFVVLAAASMAGLPPLVGFVGKEAAFEAFGHGSVRDLLVLCGLVVGSMLTVAYSLRFLVGAFGPSRGVAPTSARRPGLLLSVPMAVPSACGLVVGVGLALLRPFAEGYASAYPAEPGYELALWHGWTLPLLLSATVLLGGYGVYQQSGFISVRGSWLPEPLHAQSGYRGAIRGLDAVAHAVTGRVQVGSLPTYLGVILIVVVVLPGTGLLVGVGWPDQLRWWDSPMQAVLAALALIACGTVVMARRRLTAVLLTGVVGYAIGALFVVDGGSDLALAQFLVESLTLVVFVFVLRRFPPQFRTATPPTQRRRWLKALVASAGGVFVATMAVLFSGNRQGQGLPEASTGYIDRAEQDAGASNIVNAIIVDFRAFDTIGEISVLAVAATGAASLILAAHRARRRLGPQEPLNEPVAQEEREMSR